MENKSMPKFYTVRKQAEELTAPKLSIKSRLLTSKQLIMTALMTLMFTLTIVGASASATEPEQAIQLNFNATQMFQWAQMILDVMMPVLYITLGVSLAFIVIRALKQAFQ